MDVVLVRWPKETSKRDELVDRGRPRLLLVDPETAPPDTVDLLEDWVRLPAAEADVRARVRNLEVRVGRLMPSTPTIDATGCLRFRLKRVQLTALQARLLRALTSDLGTVVSRETLAGVVWPEGEGRRNTLDVHIMRVRRLVEPLGLEIRTVRSRGYLLRVAVD